jgi:putative ABC transport system substrate-binding protein
MMRLASLALAFVVLAVSLEVGAQPATITRIGVLSPGYPGPSPLLDAFVQGLRELGYVEKRSIAIEYRFAEGRPERLPALAAELVQLNVAAILTVNTPASRAAKSATNKIPIVFAWVADPAAGGLVANFARPEANATGLTTFAPELSGKRLELLKQTVTGLSRVSVLWNSANPTATDLAKEMEGAAPQVGIQIHALPIRSPDELPKAFESAARNRAGALFVIEEAMLLPHRRRILDLAAKQRLPTASQFREFADAGGLLSYGPNLPDLFRRAAIYVDRILKGAKPGDLPVQQPTKLELVINRRTANALGVTISPSLLLQADQVLE